MTAVSLALVAEFLLSCPVSVNPASRAIIERAVATAYVESHFELTALHDNTTGKSYRPKTDFEAATLAATLQAQGHSIDAGLMQINDANWSRFGLTSETVFDPRHNVCAGVAILAEAYAIERRVSCRYNIGRPDCTNGYPERIDSALRRVRADSKGDNSAALRAAKFPAAPPPTSPFVGHGPVREMMFAPNFRPIAISQEDAHPAVPAVPDNPIAAPDKGRSELVTMRSEDR